MMRIVQWSAAGALSFAMIGFVGLAAADAVTLDYNYRYGGDLTSREKNWLTEFTKQHPDIHVDLSTGAGDYFNKIKVAIIGGQGPDLFTLTTLNVPEFAQAGLVANLAPFFERDKAQLNDSTVFPAAIDGGRYPANGGSIYATPINYVTSLVFYNPDLFSKAGIAPPDDSWTWDTFAQAAAKLTISGNGQANDVIHGYSMSGSDYVDVQPAIASNGGTFLNAAHTAAALDNPAAADTIAFFANLIKSGAAVQQGLSPFIRGKAAMTIDGSFVIDSIAAQKAPYAIALLPKGRVRRADYGASDMLAISAKAKDLGAAWEVAKASMLDRGAAFYINSGWLPVSKAITRSAPWRASRYNNPVFFKAALYMTNTASLNWYSWMPAASALINQAINGRIPPQQAVKQANTIINTAIQQGTKLPAAAPANAVAVKNGQLEIAAAQNVYAHVDRKVALSGRTVMLQGRIKVMSNPGTSWAPSLWLYWGPGESVGAGAETGSLWLQPKGGAKGTAAPLEWEDVRITYDTQTQTATTQQKDPQTGEWQTVFTYKYGYAGMPSYVIVGKGYGTGKDPYAKPMLANAYKDPGLPGISDIDDVTLSVDGKTVFSEDFAKPLDPNVWTTTVSGQK